VATPGIVRAWLDEQGWGVIDSPETPGGCWTHFSAVAVADFARLGAGQEVLLEGEEAAQDGFAYRAVRTWPADRQPVDPVVEPGGTGAYSSAVTITYNGDAPEYVTR
jgi:CspA family cold shock protein